MGYGVGSVAPVTNHDFILRAAFFSDCFCVAVVFGQSWQCSGNQVCITQAGLLWCRQCESSAGAALWCCDVGCAVCGAHDVSFQMPVPPVRCGWLLAMTDNVTHKQTRARVLSIFLHLFLSYTINYNRGMPKTPAPPPAPRPHSDRGQGRKSMSGLGKSPTITLRLPAPLIDKIKERGGSAWVRRLVEAA